MNKKSSYLMAAAFLWGAAVCAQSLTLSPLTEGLQLEALGMSANHRYICGLNVASYQGFVWDTQSNQVIQHTGDYANCDFRAVTNEGVAYGILGLDDMVTTNAACFGSDGKPVIVDDKMSQIFAVTPDGKVAVGCLLDEMWSPSACVWIEGERIMLPCPTAEECGIANDGANAQFVSADGSVIAGYMQDWMSSRPAVIWRRQADGSYQADVISAPLWELHIGEGKPYLRFQPLGLSANGKWLCLAAQREADETMPTPEFMARMNLETGEVFDCEMPVVEYFDPETDQCYPNSIADDGTCVGVVMDAIGFMRGAIWRAGEASPRLLADILPDIKELYDYDGFMHLPISISPDGQFIGGYACPLTYDEEGMPVAYDFQSYLLSLGGVSGISSLQSIKLPGSRHNLLGQPVGEERRGFVIENHTLQLR